MRTYIIILAVLMFLTVTISVSKVDVPTRKSVTFSTKGFNIQNKNINLIVQIKNMYTKLKLTSINDIDLKSTPTNIEYKNINNYNNSQVNDNVRNVDINIQNQNVNNYNSSPVQDNVSNVDPNIQNNAQNGVNGEYSLKISWNEWRSNIVNKILNDSYKIPELNKYASGTGFYYSFDVDNEGNINNIIVLSLNMESQDLQLIKMLIQSYSHTQLVVFPNNSKRNTIRVDAICLFDDETQEATSSDFHDIEKVDVKY